MDTQDGTGAMNCERTKACEEDHTENKQMRRGDGCQLFSDCAHTRGAVSLEPTAEGKICETPKIP